jgi:hypothetical protein
MCLRSYYCMSVCAKGRQTNASLLSPNGSDNERNLFLRRVLRTLHFCDNRHRSIEGA